MARVSSSRVGRLGEVLVLAALLGCASTPGRPPAAAARGACLADDLGPIGHADDFDDAACGSGAACGDACARGDAIACYVRANEIQSETSRPDDADPLYERACRAGLAIGCTNYAASLWSHGGHVENACALRLFEKTCAADEAWGCGMLGRLIVDAAAPPGDGSGSGKPTPGESAELARGRGVLESACTKLGRFPCRALALEIEHGAFGPSDPEAVRKLLERACATGDTPACGRPAHAGDTFH
jgi:hypothetical protein